MTDVTVPPPAAHAQQVETAELEHDAMGFRDAIVIGLASTAPAYSLAVIGTVAVGVLPLGAVLLLLWRLGGNERLFGRRPFEAVDPAVARGDAAPVGDEP
ncbi:MAG TPA: hypothetical protein VJ689_08845 [Gaiellaceae bacterium]|nr:hypothetical protein [Gaiellaceae bacterium]